MDDWRNSLYFKLTAGCVILFLALTATLGLVLQIRLQEKLQQELIEQVETRGAHLVSEMAKHGELAKTLAQSLANYASTAERDSKQFSKVLAALLDIHDPENIIAGGGFWPEPYAFDKNVERSSFFWGKNSTGQLEYFDDYNTADGAGYHHEEWYAPARFLKRGQCYWSRSYIDPHSLQPMVTCTVPVIAEGSFIGAATIDMKLEGMAGFFAAQTADSGSYAFAVDQNNKFIAYPDKLAIEQTDSHERITSADLAHRDVHFKPIANELARTQMRMLEKMTGAEENYSELIDTLHNSSYQINQSQAKIIAASIASPAESVSTGSMLIARVPVDNDSILQEPALASIFQVPGTFWKVVVVSSRETVLGETRAIVRDVLQMVVLAIALIMVLAFVALRRCVINPINEIAEVFKHSGDDHIATLFLDEHRKDEFGRLAHWYNLRAEELRQSRNNRENLTRDLESSKNELTEIINALDGVVWECDATCVDLPFTFVSEKSLEIYGFTPQQLMEEEYKQQFMQSFGPGEGESFAELVFSMEPSVKSCEHTHTYRRPDGRWITLQAIITPVWQSENLIALRGVSLDISGQVQRDKEHEELELQLRQAQKLEAVGQLAAGIAHEINTPAQFVGDNINFMKDAFQDIDDLLVKYAALLAQSEEITGLSSETGVVNSCIKKIDLEYLREDLPNAIEQSLDGVARISSIVKAMKEFSHPGSDSKESVDLNSAIESTLTVARNEWKYVAVVDTQLDPDLPAVSCLPGEINQTVLNMVVNAAHAIEARQRQDGDSSMGTITIRTGVDDGYAMIQVGDTGTGIDKESLQKIFEPFFTTKEVGKGTGQGLAIAHSVVVDKHGGTLDVDSELGRGTVFTVKLPIASSDLQAGKELQQAS